MSEEKKEVQKKEAAKQEIPQKGEAPKTEAPQAAEKKEPGKLVRPAVCCITGKTLKRNSWFYRNGKWYASKRVYKEAKIKEKEEAAKVAQ